MILTKHLFHAALAGLALALTAAAPAGAQSAGEPAATTGAPMRLDGYGVETGVSGSRARAILDLQNSTGAGRSEITGMESGAIWDNYVKSIGKGGAGAPLKTTVTESIDTGR